MTMAVSTIVVLLTVLLTVQLVSSDDQYYTKRTEYRERIQETINHVKQHKGVKTRPHASRLVSECGPYPKPPINGGISCSSNGRCHATCLPQHQFPNGANDLTVVCQEGRWAMPGTGWEALPDCEPICLPQCLNNGICIAPNQCQCPQHFSGPQCQFENKPCLNLPMSVQNSAKRCNDKTCTVTCLNGFTFPDGTSVTNMICKSGTWVPTRPDWVTIPDCAPVCHPPCQNGGVCLALNTCQCPQEYRGQQCQHHVDNCSPKKLNFNGGYSCQGDSYAYKCTINCPEGIDFSSPPAREYICKYETGVFEPQPIPQCVPKENQQLVTVGSSKNTFSKTTNYIWRLEGSSQSEMEEAQEAYLRSQYQNARGSVKGGVKGGRVKGGSVTETIQVGDTIPQIMQPLEQFSSSVELRKPEPKTCFTWGDSHYKTFDGAIYSFGSSCAYSLVQDIKSGIFMATVQNSVGCRTGEFCHKIITIYFQGKEFILTLNKSGVPTLKLKNKVLPIPTQLVGMRVQMTGQFVNVFLDPVGASLKWDSRLFVQVTASESLWNRTEGLCGNMNGDVRDDRNGKFSRGHHLSTAALSNEWKVQKFGELCDDYHHVEEGAWGNDFVLHQESEAFCTKLFSDERFSSCSKVVDLAALKAACQWDYTTCKNSDRKTCACDTMNVYVKQCFHDGLTDTTAWRKEDVCPMNCSGGKIYKSCGPKNEPSCNDNENKLSSSAVDRDCEEGCFCPEGTVLHNGKCISKEECPCLLRGKVFKPGAIQPKDCNTCTCSSGSWVCTEVACAARCAAVGDPHYVTFDGKAYDFMGKCNYYLVKGDNYSIETENVACHGAISEAMGFSRENSMETPSCTKSVTIRLPQIKITLKQNRHVAVNDEEIKKFPLLAGGVRIRMASSIFLVAKLPSGLEIWWDGISRVYVNAPPQFRGKTQGLCGTFTRNQKDDFRTPYGDVEQSVVDFANKWKTSEQCGDVPQKDYVHPCDADPERMATAEKHCSKIWSQLFASCHWYVDPEIFYKNCKYDMCSCEGKVENCLCPTLAAYAKECAAFGVNILWRTEVEECQLHCPAGQEYQICGNSCTRSCSDIAFNEDCRQECVEGCNCPEGQTLNAYGECIPIGQCPCVFNGNEFDAGHRGTRPGTKSQDLCTCTAGLWHCQSATKEELKEYSSLLTKTVCRPSENLEPTTCEPAEPRTCRNMHQPIDQSPAICRPGCVCKEGYVLDSISKKCVKKEHCPCYHGGRSYKDGATMQEECNTCKCEGGKWNCTDRICAGICSAWGDSHYKTFDDKTYDFQGICDYVLAKASFGADDCFEVSTQNVPCGSGGVACSKSVTLSIGNGNNQEKITLTRGKDLPKGNFTRIVRREAGMFVFLDVPDLGLTLQWDKGTRVYVKLDPKWRGRTKGLCGDYNDNSEDDFKTPSGGISEASASLFGDSWKKDNYCPEPKEITDTCSLHPERRIWAIEKCGILKSPLFQSCHSEVDIEPYVERCIFDTCGCDGGGDCECLCTALASYAHECNRRGVPIKWRSQQLCPMQCDEKCSTYSPCISTCSRETCDNLSHLQEGSRLCLEDTCVEGCLTKTCPEGQVWRNSSFHECVPRAECKPICIEKEGVIYYEGDKVSSDACQSCYCSRGKVLCSGSPCTTTVQPTVVIMEESAKCVSGWSKWINSHIVKPQAQFIKTKTIKPISEDIEPLPSMLDLLALKNSSRCSKQFMVDIKCRTVNDHINHKETGLDVECSLERGLYCKSTDKNQPCVDFEISVLCQCEEPTTTTTRPIPEHITKDECQLNTYTASKEDCYVFYECQPTPNGNKLVKKTCGPTMYFNTHSNTCDWPHSVALFRPECGQVIKTTTEAPSRCKYGEKYDECAIQCSKTCNYYYYTLEKQGLCGKGKDCIPGCIPENRICPTGKVWRDESSCVEQRECPCTDANGNFVKPGDIVDETKCKRCQCLNNYYSCDESLCRATKRPRIKQPPPTTPTTPIAEYTTIVPSTSSPPEPCTSGHLTSLLKNVIFNASSLADSSDSYNKVKGSPVKTKKPTKVMPSVGSFWEPEYEDTEQWLEIQLPRVEPVYGITLMANPDSGRFVTSYKILYSQDGHTFSYIPKVFNGPIDAFLPVQQILPEPIEAKYIRINPRTWHHGISMSVDILGCQDLEITTPPPPMSAPTPQIHEETIVTPICDDIMGLDNGIMVDEQVIASSTLDSLIPNLKLSSPGIWRPKLDNPQQYVEFNFLENRNLTGVETKGSDDIWTSAYKVYYADRQRNWIPIVDSTGEEKIFLGNFDDSTPKINYFNRPVSAQYLKIQPVKWHNHVGLKAEVHGCYVPYPVQPQTTPQPTPPHIVQQKCKVCDGIYSEGPCDCSGSQLWNGKSCVDPSLCPCVVGGIPYEVSAVFEKNDCEICTCGMNGNATCVKKACEPCEDLTMRSVVTELCGCVCKPCPPGERLCRKSNICIKESLWCNGVHDCLDDETGCVRNEIVNQTSILVTTTEVKNVTQIECYKPTCSPGYRLAEKKKAKVHKPPPPFPGSVKGGIKGGFKPLGAAPPPFPGSVKGGVKGGFRPLGAVKGQQRQAKSPNKQDVSVKETDIEVQCPEWTCEPIAPPLPFDESNKQQCPKIECQPGYRVVVKPQSMYELVPCPTFVCLPPKPVDAVCYVSGRVFNTFDRLEYKYDICNHILARDMYFNKWFITLEKHCSIPKQPCMQVVAVVIDGDVVVMYPNGFVDINQYSFTPQQIVRFSDPRGAYKIARIGNALQFSSPKYGFWIISNANGEVKVGIDTRLSRRVDGMCGFFDGNSNNDRQMYDGRLARTAEEFGDSWQMDGTPQCDTQGCPKNMYDEAKEICETILDRSFEVCASVLDLKNYVTKCIESTCMCINANMTAEECRCRSLTTFATDCQAAEENVDLSTWRDIHNCPIDCPAPLVYRDCFRNKCEPSCENLQEIEPCPKMQGVCFPGCFCPDGKVRNGDECVSPTECRDCSCDGFGNSNYLTFDKKNFTFAGNCTYVLSQDILTKVTPIKGVKGVKGIQNKSPEHTYQVLMTNVPCDKGVCTETLAIIYKAHWLELKHDMLHNSILISLDSQPIEKVPFKNSFLRIERVSTKDIKVAIPLINLEMTVYEHNFAFNLRLPSHTFARAVEGLCGNCNDNIDDDFKKQNGELTDNVDEFGMSWLVTGLPTARVYSEEECTSQPVPQCLPPPPADDVCMTLLNPETFGQCHNLIDPTPFIDACHNTLCEKGEVCSDFERYSAACREAGLCPNWRTYDFCPFTCDKNDLVYQPCGSSCPDTCETLNDVNKPKCSTILNEGCFCPEGHVYHNNTCMPEKKCFICDDQGHIEGDIWHPDKCTTCSCSKKTVKCQTTECPLLESICEEGANPMLVESSADECCPKYRCVPVPTVGPTCAEPQPLDCGYGQIVKLSKGPDGCPKFICECLPAEECPRPQLELSNEINSPPGYVEVMNTTGCCPKLQRVCKPETCPPSNCPEYYEIKTTQHPEACCPTHECSPPKDLCLITPKTKTKNTKTRTIARKIGEIWKDGLCKECTCEKNENGAEVHCTTTECNRMESHSDYNDYVLRAKDIGECCPVFERTICKDNGTEYEIGDVWHPKADDACYIGKCEIGEKGVHKTIIKQECPKECDAGFEYRPPADPASKCCGECVSLYCDVDGHRRDFNEKWHSEDFCTNYTCILDGRKPRVKESVKDCEKLDKHEEEHFKIETKYTPGVCCPQYIRSACKVHGKVYQVGEIWKNSEDPCVTLTCSKEFGKIEIKEVRQNCSEKCDFGWEYQKPAAGECCGRCKQAHCIDHGVLHEPGTVWHSKDTCWKFECKDENEQMRIKETQQKCNATCEFGFEYEKPAEGECCGRCKQAHCIDKGVLYKPGDSWKSTDECYTFTCKRDNDQMVIISSAPVCPDISDCPAEDIYRDGCCERCKLKSQNHVKTCNPEELEPLSTIGKIRDVGVYHNCTNLNPIPGYTECRGDCNYEVTFNPNTWMQEATCHCCQPQEFKEIDVELTCDNQALVTRTIHVPSTCSCNTCSTAPTAVKTQRVPGVKGGRVKTSPVKNPVKRPTKI